MQINFIKPSEVKQYVNNGAQLIDLRDREDYEKKHLKQAVSMPYNEFEKKYMTLPKGRTYVLYCDRGASSMLGAKKMLAQGYQVYSVSGGFQAFFREKD